MLELLLLRHAKSRWDRPGVEDHDRDLTSRGEKAAPRMGELMRREGLVPDRVLCSTARRARRTWELVGARLGAAPEASSRSDLYLAKPAALLEAVRSDGDAARRLLLVGHNPGLHALAMRLVGHGTAPLRKALAEKFPTGALARIGFSATDWREVRPRAGTLLGFWRPRDLR
jgi:phosphohistidine phosphatase